MTTFEDYFTANNAPMEPERRYDLEHFPPDVREPLSVFCRLFPFKPPTKKSNKYALWIREAREMVSICGGESNVERWLRKLKADYTKKIHAGTGYDIAGIQSFTGPLRGLIAREKMMGESQRDKYTGGEYGQYVEH